MFYLMGVDSLLDEFRRKTVSYLPEFPNNLMRVYNDVVVVSLSQDAGDLDTININLIDVNPDCFDNGFGTKALKFITNLADKHEVTLTGIVASERKGYSDQDLTEWYKKRGMVQTGLHTPKPGIEYPILKYFPKTALK